MPITAQNTTKTRLNLPPLRGKPDGTISPAELDRFTRVVQEWGYRVDQLTNATAEAAIAVSQADIIAINATLAALETVTAKTAWTDVSFSGSWVNFDPPGAGERRVQYRKIGDVVYLRGVAKNGAAPPSFIFVLPLEFRPPYSWHEFFVQSNVSPAIIQVFGTGVVQLATGGTGFVFLDGIVFSTAA